MTPGSAYRCHLIDGELVGHVTQLRAFAVSLCGDPDIANDLVQDTLLKALSKIDSFEAGTNMRAWLFTILRNTYFTQCRRRSFEIRDEDGSIAASQCVEAAQDSHLELCDFERALQTLNDEQREALVLVGAAGFSYDEAAEIGGCSSGTIKSRVCRARARLQELLYGRLSPRSRFREASRTRVAQAAGEAGAAPMMMAGGE